MITVQSNNLLSATKEVFNKLFEDNSPVSDPEIWKENSLSMTISENNMLNGGLTLTKKLNYTFEYTKYFPFVDKSVLGKELNYYLDQLFSNGKLDDLTKFLKNNWHSKRAILSLWEESDRDLPSGGHCTNYIFFRVKERRLEMHNHMRANNCSFLIFLDAHFMMGIQNIVAQKLNLSCGDYVHIVDSFHFYKAELDSIKKQHDFMLKQNIWKNL